MEIKVMQNVLKANDVFADQTAELLKAKGIRLLNLIGSPGAGKTSVLELMIPLLKDKGLRIAVIEGDCATARDAQRIAVLDFPVVQINTGNGCHLDARQIGTVMTEFPLEDIDMVIIENVGNLVCPTGFDLGADEKIAVISVTEGDDKPLKYPRIFHEAKMVILTKIDLIPYTNFSLQRFTDALRSIRQDQELFLLSCTTGEGAEKLVERFWM